ncbi:hypothetical protein JY651_22955 [Pyxidicoccus parkwayensis]|uniref:Uncharacterized protein n=1 Tax=Pyxidicoccus parkwayensis TaxID=2813578 RepID=A0ABX7PB01_9BACT|nr:hypothetical protein [Pyxidicoccus parkwaysis]QSQ27597.1 hypothetical protein JY651_22955 [Pyxidicoccus parkwaysis]
MSNKLLSTVLFASLPAAVLATPPTSLIADSAPSTCVGTYLIQEGGGAKDFWTFAADGAFFGTTSTQPLYNFSNQQGSWEKFGSAGSRGTLFAFMYNDDKTLMATARIDISFHAVGQGCDQIAGSLVVRTFEDGEDPLDPTTDTGEPIASDTFTGRRVRARP